MAVLISFKDMLSDKRQLEAMRGLGKNEAFK